MQTVISHPVLTAADAIAQASVSAWDWYTATFFSAEASHRYQVIGEIVGHLMILTVLAGRIARAYVQPWIDAQVEAAVKPAEAEPSPVVEASLDAAAYTVFVAAEVVALARQVAAVTVEGARWVAPKVSKAIGFTLCVNW